MLNRASLGLTPLRQPTAVLASPALTRLVTHFVLHPHADLHFQALKRATKLPNRSLQVELARLDRLGLVARTADGRLVRYSVLPDAVRWEALRQVVRLFVDPAEILSVALNQVAGITAAFIYGSFARRRDVHADSDIDLFVVSPTMDQDPTRLALSSEMLEVSGFLDREINMSRYSPNQLTQNLSRRSAFARSVLAGDKEWLVGDEAQLCAAVPASRHVIRRGRSA